MRLGLLPLPAGAAAAVKAIQATGERDSQGRLIWREGDAPIDVIMLDEIGVTAKRDYIIPILVGLVILYALTSKR